MNQTPQQVEWVKVSSNIDNAPVVAAALASLGLSPKVTPSNQGRLDVWVCYEQAPEARRFLGQAPGAGWASADPFISQRLLALYTPSEPKH
ncbi:MAG TPA: hypothetical protein VHN99_01850 [Deinococcales bacterium]|nr:hypothetical protein [Deinococcales bacterium]